MCYRKYGGGEYISGDRADSCKETTTTSCLSGDNEKKKLQSNNVFILLQQIVGKVIRFVTKKPFKGNKTYSNTAVSRVDT